MRRTFLNKNLMTNIMSLAAFFIFIFGAFSCADNDFIGAENNGDNTVIGDTVISFSDFRLNEVAWDYVNGLAKAEPYFDGYVEYKVKDQVVKSDLIDHETAPMSIEWTPIAETTGSGKKMYLGSSASEAKYIESHKNQKVNFKKYERECKLSFVGMELTLTGSWYEASLGNNTNVVACRYDSTTISDQLADFEMVDGEKVIVEKDGQKYNRMVVTAKALNHFTDMPAETTHKEQMDIEYSVLVPVDIKPGEKFYEGSIAGNGSYTKASEESYESRLELTHIFTQDGKQLTEQETVSGLATVKTWVEGDNEPKIWSSANISNPSVSVNTSISENYYQKSEYIYAKMYTTVWTYTWLDTNTGESFRKEVHSEVERLYYRREAGKEVAMPYGETTTSYKGFNAGAAVIKTQNGKEYEAYSGMVSFNGNHKSTTGNLNDAIEGLVAPQEIWVAKEDEFLGYDKEIIAGSKDKDAQIIITEHWSVSGDKEIVYTQSANYSFAVSEQQRVFGENLTFVSGPSQSTDDPRYNEVKENQFVRTVTTVTSVSFNPSCVVEATAKANEAYIMYRGKKIYFEFAAATVSYKGINNPAAAEVTVDGKLYSRRSYEVTFAHSLLGNKVANVLVDKEVILDPSTPNEWGEIDIEKTKNFGRICVTWKEVAGQSKLQHFYSGTIVTTKGIISFSNGYKKFTAMDTNVITKEVGNGWDGANLNPAYINVSTNPNVSWQYYDVVSNELVADIHSSKMQTEGGIDKEKPFVANGGQANVYNITENGNTVRVVVTFNGEELFSEVFAK